MNLPVVMCTARILRRSLSFVSLSCDDSTDGFQREQQFYSSFGKSRDRKLPHRYYGLKRKEGPIKEGFLWVQSASPFNKTWKLRYVLLFDEKLCYMKPKQATDKISGAMDYTVIKFIDIVSVKINNDYKDEEHPVSDSDVFSVKTSHQKLLFRCRDQEERDQWMVSLLTAKSSSIIKEAKAK